MDKTQYSSALRNAVAFLKGQKKIKKEIQISIDTGFSKGAVRYWRLAMRNAQPGQYVFGKGLKPNVIPTTAAQVTRRWEIHVKDGMGITANYNSLRHSLATDMADNYGQEITATHLQHKGQAMIRKVYDKKAEQREHESAKKRVVRF